MTNLERELIQAVCLPPECLILFLLKLTYIDGAGLACGLFEYLLNLGNEKPKVLAATHFHEIFENGFLLPRPELQFGYMEVQMDPEAQEIEDQLTYLYKLRQLHEYSHEDVANNEILVFDLAGVMKALAQSNPHLCPPSQDAC